MFSADGMTATMNSPEAVEAAAFFQQLAHAVTNAVLSKPTTLV